MTRSTSFPLFPLDLVLLPHELVPLHIFEERYKTMVASCLEQEGEFGIVWLSDDGLKEVGCAARITRVLERFEDGRSNILIQGTSPFRLLRRIDALPYPAGEVSCSRTTRRPTPRWRRPSATATPRWWPR